MAPFSFPIQRDIVIACFAVHNFIRKCNIRDQLFMEYGENTVFSEIQGGENVGQFVQNEDEEDEYNVDEDAGNEEDDAREKKGKTKSTNWTKLEEEALAKAWVHCSTNKKKGNQQNRESFWRKILEHFNKTVGGSNRTVHQVRSKWNPMMTKINFFNGLYQQADRTRGSGCKDLDVMKVALKEFKDKFPNGFQHVEAWEVVRRHEKWAQVPLLGEEGEGSAHKRKPVEVDPSIPDMNEDPSPQRAQRRDKRQATSSEGSSAELAKRWYNKKDEWKTAADTGKVLILHDWTMDPCDNPL
ncbi:glutathione S-transferase T3-like [Helianthus annuus]|uniref:glutathione S-transferase T3-like n=1 Tax=Helianthus annuus TaxID=4232 RepID=UPI001652FDD8|nr:glutathione S-transferase T3-like [Helianthus annuus]